MTQETKQEKVIVLVPAWNSENYLEESLTSLVRQTYKPLEVLVVNDGSTDKTKEILETYKKQHNNISCIDIENNKGIVKALNTGIDHIIKEHKEDILYVARMDSDDICNDDRIIEQVTFLKSHPYVQILSSNVIVFSTNEPYIHTMKSGEQKRIEYPSNPIAIDWSMFFYCPLNHPCVMFNWKQLSLDMCHYDDKYSGCEDYYLWFRLLFDYNCIAMNLKQPLLRLRKHSSNVSTVKSSQQRHNALQVSFFYANQIISQFNKRNDQINDDQKNEQHTSDINKNDNNISVCNKEIWTLLRALTTRANKMTSKQFQQCFDFIDILYQSFQYFSQQKWNKVKENKLFLEKEMQTELDGHFHEGMSWVTRDMHARLGEIVTLCMQTNIIDGFALLSRWKQKNPPSELLRLFILSEFAFKLLIQKNLPNNLLF
ncbi:glycosyltransferase, group 2 family [Reticulomyxa filosa]|uniref:Glycosyltransferase, group 2 family n=1 Tax=Reticulomyxa filosa TaxID=46433 RepID=X6M4U5_RETFI|nr:glycosyltransferase, group 2 family [Reticulomyxa filosa]|eukprot:ETO08666.1 glycosyltransferase, group 2 family [Reticulomyxa filosa]